LAAHLSGPLVTGQVRGVKDVVGAGKACASPPVAGPLGHGRPPGGPMGRAPAPASAEEEAGDRGPGDAAAAASQSGANIVLRSLSIHHL
jgi:hypothetical protein